MIPARPCRGILSKLRAAASLRIPTRDNPSRAQWASSASFSETLSMRRCGRCGAGAQEHGVDEGSGAGLALGPCLRWLQALTHVLLGSGAHVLLRCCDRVRAETAEQAAVRLARIRGAVWASPRALDERGLGQTRGQTRASRPPSLRPVFAYWIAHPIPPFCSRPSWVATVTRLLGPLSRNHSSSFPSSPSPSSSHRYPRRRTASPPYSHPLPRLPAASAASPRPASIASSRTATSWGRARRGQCTLWATRPGRSRRLSTTRFAGMLPYLSP